MPGLVVLALLVPLVVPLAPWALDAALLLNFALSVGLLGASVEAPSAAFASLLPALILGSSLFRLSLEVASSRLLLGRGVGGAVIASLGRVGTQGDLAVGLVGFGLVALVQYLVVARGSERAAEVAARFALDAMPGQQLSVESSERAGHLDAAAAAEARGALWRDAARAGAMDGALRFVRGESIAGVVITATNLVAGVGLGVFRDGLALRTAADRYGTLAVGQGLAAQLPSLLVAAAAGFAVTLPGEATRARAGVGALLRGQPAGLLAVAGVCAALAVVSPLPALPLLLLAGSAVALWSWSTRRVTAPRLVVGAPSAAVDATRVALAAALEGMGAAHTQFSVTPAEAFSLTLDGVLLEPALADAEALFGALRRLHPRRVHTLASTRAMLALPGLAEVAAMAQGAGLSTVAVAELFATLCEEGVVCARRAEILDRVARLPRGASVELCVAEVRQALGAEGLGLSERPLRVWKVSPALAELLREHPRLGGAVEADLREACALAWAESDVNPKVLLVPSDLRSRLSRSLASRFDARVVGENELGPTHPVRFEGWVGPEP